MNDIDAKEAFLKLYSAINAEEVSKLLKNSNFFKNSYWRPYGNIESNFSIINAQSRDPINALVEKIVNSIDAMLTGECYKRNIDPKSTQAPQSMLEAIMRFFNIPKGDISLLDAKERRRLAQYIKVIAEGDKGKPNLIIVDSGEGQNPDDFFKTFLSLPTDKRNKADIKFVQGKFNMGGSGALMFCGCIDNRYQLILSKRNPQITNSKNLWAFTLVRQITKPNSNFPIFECLVDQSFKIYTFESAELSILPEGDVIKYGSVIKLYNYFLKNPSNINLDLWRPLNRKLFTPALPITLIETRFEKEKIHGTSRIMEGNKYRINGDENKWVEKYFQIKSDLGRLGTRNIEITLFKDELKEKVKQEIKVKPFPSGEFMSPTESMFFTVNGQTHHTIGRSTLETQANLKNLAKFLMVHIDVSNVGAMLHEIFHGAREGARDNEIYKEIEDRLLSDLRDNPLLKSLDEEYRRREIAKVQPDKGFARKIATRILKENSEWTKQLLNGVDIPITGDKGKNTKFVPSNIPTYFKLKGNAIKLIPINNKYSWINFNTDAPNDYLTRNLNRGDFIIISSIPIEKSYWLNEGLLSLKIITPKNTKVGYEIKFKVSLSRQNDTSLDENFTLQYTEVKVKLPGHSQPREPKGEEYGLPELVSISREDWEKHDPVWNAKEIARVKSAIIQINVDSNDLHSFLNRYEKRYTRDSIVEAYKTAIYLYAFILDNELSGSDSQSLIVSENKEKLVSKLMQGISKIVLPLNFEGFLEEIN